MKVENKLNPFYETIALLFASVNVKEDKQNKIWALDQCGIKGEDFYEKHLQLYARYLEMFIQHRVWNESYEKYVKCLSQELYVITLVILLQYQNTHEKGEGITEEKVKQELLLVCQRVNVNIKMEDLESTQRIVEVLEGNNLEDKEKWWLMQILMDPKAYFDELYQIVNLNIEAYHQAIGMISKEVQSLINQWIEEGKVSMLISGTVEDIMEPDSVCYPSLGHPIDALLNEGKAFIGIFHYLLASDSASNFSREMMIKSLKAISDKTRLDILTSLKKSPKYNLELASILGLRASTVSHHMSILEANNLVMISKESGKVHYHINKEEARKLVDSLESILI